MISSSTDDEISSGVGDPSTQREAGGQGGAKVPKFGSRDQQRPKQEGLVAVTKTSRNVHIIFLRKRLEMVRKS